MLAGIGSKIDFLVRHINTINNKPVLAQHAAEGHYALAALEPAESATTGLFFNQTDKDAKLRELLTNHDFAASRGKEPSASMGQRLKLWDEWKQAPTEAKPDDLFKQILQLAADAFEVTGTVQGVVTFEIRSEHLMNVPDKLPLG